MNSMEFRENMANYSELKLNCLVSMMQIFFWYSTITLAIEYNLIGHYYSVYKNMQTRIRIIYIILNLISLLDIHIAVFHKLLTYSWNRSQGTYHIELVNDSLAMHLLLYCSLKWSLLLVAYSCCLLNIYNFSETTIKKILQAAKTSKLSASLNSSV